MEKVKNEGMMFRASMLNDQFEPGIESLEVKLFEEKNIPWDEIAFKVIKKTLERYLSDRVTKRYLFFIDDIYFDPLTKSRKVT